MSNYIIPDGWNPMTEKWEEGRTVNILYCDGRVVWTSRPSGFNSPAVAWQYPVPLEKKRRFEVRQSVHNINKWSVFDASIRWDHPACVCAQNIKSKQHAEAFAKYLEDNEP